VRLTRSAIWWSENVAERKIIGCDGVPKSAQKWVREGKLSATVISPPLMSDAMQMLLNALKSGRQPAERIMITPSSFPGLNQLQKEQPTKPGKTS
jgi:ABC-type sugar transport system substrate-binding protein